MRLTNFVTSFFTQKKSPVIFKLIKNLLVGGELLLMGSVGIKARATPKWEGVRYIIRKINPLDTCIVSLSRLKQSWKSEGLSPSWLKAVRSAPGGHLNLALRRGKRVKVVRWLR